MRSRECLDIRPKERSIEGALNAGGAVHPNDSRRAGLSTCGKLVQYSSGRLLGQQAAAFALFEDPFNTLQRAGDVDGHVNTIGLESAKHPNQGSRRFRQKEPDTISALTTGCVQ